MRHLDGPRAVIVAVLALVLAGCGGGDEPGAATAEGDEAPGAGADADDDASGGDVGEDASGGDAGEDASGGDAGEDAPAGDAGEVTVTIEDADGFGFEPAAAEVAVGGTVTWEHAGRLPHTVTAEDATFDSGSLSPEETFSFTPDAPGEHTYTCSFHPSMTGTVTVTG